MKKPTAILLEELDRKWREADEERDYLERHAEAGEGWTREVHARLVARAEAAWIEARAAYFQACGFAPLSALLTHAEHNADRLAMSDGNATTVRAMREAIAEVRRARRAVNGRAERLYRALRGAAWECGEVLFRVQLEGAARRVASSSARAEGLGE